MATLKRARANLVGRIQLKGEGMAGFLNRLNAV
jgi:hypothetical protein